MYSAIALKFHHSFRPNAPFFPNVYALVQGKYPDNEQASQIVTWMQYAMACVQPSIDYFVALLEGDLAIPLKIFRIARIFNPMFAWTANITSEMLNDLRAFPAFKNNDIIEELAAKLPVYLSLLETVKAEISFQTLWKIHNASLPSFCCLKRLLLFQPSSAAAERVFSLLKHVLRASEGGEILNDWLELSVMKQYNDRKKGCV